MSAWYVWSALGMYPVEPGSGELVLGSPLFDRAVVRPAQGATTLVAPKATARPYIDQATWTDLDGHVSEEVHRSFVTTQQLRSGGTLDLADVLAHRATDLGSSQKIGRRHGGHPQTLWLSLALKPREPFKPRAPRSSCNTFSLRRC